MRLRLGVSVIDLADRFQISKTTAADTFLEIVNVWIHDGRVIGNLRKKYLILSGTIPNDFLIKNDNEKVTTLDKIVHTSCTLINLCPSVVPLE